MFAGMFVHVAACFLRSPALSLSLSLSLVLFDAVAICCLPPPLFTRTDVSARNSGSIAGALRWGKSGRARLDCLLPLPQCMCCAVHFWNAIALSASAYGASSPSSSVDCAHLFTADTATATAAAAVAVCVGWSKVKPSGTNTFDLCGVDFTLFRVCSGWKQAGRHIQAHSHTPPTASFISSHSLTFPSTADSFFSRSF